MKHISNPSSVSSNSPGWEEAWRQPDFRRQFVSSVSLLALVLSGFFLVLKYAEQRHGFVIEKGYLDGVITPHDFSAGIFSCTYLATLLALGFCFAKPYRTLLLVRTYLILQFLRALSMLLFPLDPPQGIIPLDDPFLHATFYNGRPNLKDLFFSGHVATLLMFVPVIPQKWMKALLICAAFTAGILLVCQRVHYILDVIAAPLFSVVAFLLATEWPPRERGMTGDK